LAAALAESDHHLKLKEADFESLSGQVRSLTAELADRQWQLSEQQKASKELAKQRSQVQTEMEEWKAAATALQEQGDDLRSSISISSTTRDVTSKVLLDMSGRAMQMEAERLQMQEMMQTLTTEVEDLLQKRDEEVAALRQESAEQMRKIEAACKEEYECELKTLQATLRLRESELSRVLQHEAYLQEKVKCYERRLAANGDAVSNDYQGLRGSISMSEDSLDSLFDQMTGMDGGAPQYQDGSRRANKVQVVSSLEEQLDSKDKMISTLREREQSWVDNLAAISEERTALKAELSRVSAKLQDAGRELDCVQHDRDQYRKKVEELGMQHGQAEKQLEVAEQVQAEMAMSLVRLSMHIPPLLLSSNSGSVL